MAFRKAYASLVISIPVVLGRLLRHFVPRKILFYSMLLSDRDFAIHRLAEKQSIMAFRKDHDKTLNGIGFGDLSWDTLQSINKTKSGLYCAWQKYAKAHYI